MPKKPSGKFVQLVGKEELAELLIALIDKDLRPFLLEGTKESAERVADRARAYVPTGETLTLLETIKVRRATGTGSRRLNRRRAFGHVAGHFKRSDGDPFYARFLEFGTKFIQAIRYWRRALDDSESEVMSIMARHMAFGLRQISAEWRRKLPIPKGFSSAPVATTVGGGTSGALRMQQYFFQALVEFMTTDHVSLTATRQAAREELRRLVGDEIYHAREPRDEGPAAIVLSRSGGRYIDSTNGPAAAKEWTIDLDIWTQDVDKDVSGSELVESVYEALLDLLPQYRGLLDDSVYCQTITPQIEPIDVPVENAGVWRYHYFWPLMFGVSWTVPQGVN